MDKKKILVNKKKRNLNFMKKLHYNPSDHMQQ